MGGPDVQKRIQRTNLDQPQIEAISKSCGLLDGVLAHLICQRGHLLPNHPTATHRER